MAGVKSAGYLLPPSGVPAFFIMQSSIIEKIKEKKPLDRLDDEFVQSFLDEFFKSNFKLKKKFLEDKLKKADEKKIIKNARNELNKIYGQFWDGSSFTIDSHKSTKERKEFYHSLYKKIFLITGEPKKILDLGCGLNPLTYNLIPNYKYAYFIATELTDFDCMNIRKIFSENKINGEVIKTDLRDYNNFPDVGICFMFKLLESIETKGHKLAEHLLTSIKSDYFVASFSVYNIRGIKMNYPKRGWFERLLKRIGYKFTKIYEKNEIFYIIRKN